MCLFSIDDQISLSNTLNHKYFKLINIINMNDIWKLDLEKNIIMDVTNDFETYKLEIISYHENIALFKTRHVPTSKMCCPSFPKYKLYLEINTDTLEANLLWTKRKLHRKLSTVFCSPVKYSKTNYRSLCTFFATFTLVKDPDQ